MRHSNIAAHGHTFPHVIIGRCRLVSFSRLSLSSPPFPTILTGRRSPVSHSPLLSRLSSPVSHCPVSPLPSLTVPSLLSRLSLSRLSISRLFSPLSSSLLLSRLSVVTPSGMLHCFIIVSQSYDWIDLPEAAEFLPGTLVAAMIYVLRVYYVQGFYVVSYGLGIYILNLLIGFLSPKVDPELEQLDGASLPTI
ncbi:hypothetical protein ACFE04_026056 [Oxalis oulophora]